MRRTAREAMNAAVKTKILKTKNAIKFFYYATRRPPLRQPRKLRLPYITMFLLLSLIPSDAWVGRSRRAVLTTAAASCALTRPKPLFSTTLADAQAAMATALVRELLVDQPMLRGTLLRLAFHDCVTRDGGEGGSNGSVRFELDWRENRHLDVAVSALDKVHAQLSDAPLGGVSFADLIALAGAEAVASAGGPAISPQEIGTGRVDASTADPRFLRRPIVGGGERCPPVPAECRAQVSSTLPTPGLSTDGMRAFFRRLGFSDDETVALCGAHSLGRHASLLGVSKECLRMRPTISDTCIEQGRRLPFVTSNPDTFDNSYFKALLKWESKALEPDEAYFIPTDVTLVLDPGFRRLVQRFASDEAAFFAAWRRAYCKLVRIGV